MGSDQNILLVCRGFGELHLLQGIQPQPGCRYLVASDDLRVHLEMEKYPWVSAVCFLEQMESFYAVAADVIKYLELINQWLKSLGDEGKGISPELLFWVCACEGGKTTQRIQDLLLLIRSYQYLLDTHDITSIILLRHPQAEWEDDVLIKVGQSKGVEIQILGGVRFSILKAKLQSWIKLLAREPYYIIYILRAKISRRLRHDRPDIPTKEIVMQLCSEEEKHIENILPLMRGLKSRSYSPVSLHWRASEAVARIRHEGLGAEELETYLPIQSLWEAPYRVWMTWRQAILRRNEFLGHPGLKYRNISLGPLLWPSVQSFFGEELAQRYRLQQAAQVYFAHHFPKALKVWGGGVLPEGSIVLRSLKGNQKPLILYWFWIFQEDPYESDYRCIDFFLAAGECQKDHLERLGVSSQRIALVGLSRYDHLEEFQKEYIPEQSRAYLNIPQDFQKYILFDSNYPLRGYLTIQEQSLVTNALLNFARENPSVALIIKPHPAHQPGWLEGLIDYFSLPNIFLINKNKLPYHALNAADLLITKISTIALEAMLFKVPVISVILDKEDHFKNYGTAIEYLDNIEDLSNLLETFVIGDENSQWTINQLEEHKRFLTHFLGDRSRKAFEYGAEIIDNLLKGQIN